MISLLDIHLFFEQYTIAVPFAALFFAIIMKGCIHALKGRFTVNKMFGSGGMPSAHSTFVVALATAMGIKHGAWSDQFMVCLVFSIIIIYDAMNVRYQAGLHAKAINELTPHDGRELNETLGHTPFEAIIGGVIGFLTAVLLLGV
jgi:uncharacterized protein